MSEARYEGKPSTFVLCSDSVFFILKINIGSSF